MELKTNFQELDSMEMERINGGDLANLAAGLTSILGSFQVLAPGYIPKTADAVVLQATPKTDANGFTYLDFSLKTVQTTFRIPTLVPISISNLLSSF